MDFSGTGCSLDADIPIPILTEENIIQSVKDFINIQFSVSELRKPTREKLQTILGAFVCSMLQISNEQMTQIPLHVMETIANHDLHVQEGAGLILFYKALAYFFEKCGIRDFALNDIFHPTKKRTRKLLSAIVNFVQFIGAYCNPATSEILSSIDISVKKQEQYIRKMETLPIKISELKSKRLERQRAVQDLNLIPLKAFSEELEAVKKEKIENNARSEAGVEELRNLLIIARANRSTDEALAAVDMLKSRASAMIIKEDLVVTQIEEVTPTALRLIRSIEQELAKVQVLTNELEKIKDLELLLSKDIKCISAEKQNIESLINVTQDKKSRFIARCYDLNKFAKDTELKLSIKKKSVQDDIKAKQDQSCKEREELKQIEQLIQLYEAEHQFTMKKLSDSFTSLQSKLNDYNDKVIEAYP